MELNNFEKQVQQKLNNREIKPSSNSWDRLDAMLSVEEKPKKKRKWSWLYMAASLILFISIGYYFYSQESNIEVSKKKSIIVDVEKKTESEDKEAEINVYDKEKQIVVKNDTTTDSNPNTSIGYKKGITIDENANQEPVNHNSSVVSIINPISKDKINSVSLEVDKEMSTKQNKYVSPEKLLAEVSDENYEIKNETNKTSKKIKKGVKVSANSLLSNAETELNQSYRDLAISKLNKNFNSIKTVLVNRNYEE